MPFDFYERLDHAQQATYRRSAAVASITVPDVAALESALGRLRAGLERDELPAVSRAVAELLGGICGQLKVPTAAIEVLERRPSSETSELHGLYTREDDGQARIQLWTRTAAHQKPVAFRTFLRTALHELLHHLDFEHLRLDDTFHTEGFFQRESSLVRQLAGAPSRKPAFSPRPAQLGLFPDPPPEGDQGSSA